MVGLAGLEPATFRPQTDALPGCAIARLVNTLITVFFYTQVKNFLTLFLLP